MPPGPTGPTPTQAETVKVPPTPNPFLNPDPSRIFLENELIRGLWDAFPVSPYHALLIPRRPAPTWFDATTEEQQALTAAIGSTREIIEHECRKKGLPLPDGYNIGINAGAAAGQTVFHLHVHVIPRYSGDVADPRGGVRHVIPSKGNYLVKEAPVSDYGRGGHTYTGGDQRLLQAIRRDLLTARTVDLAVAFIQESGINALFHDLEDMLVQRNGTCRLVTGDYLDITHPNALERLLELSFHSKGHLQVRIYQTRLAGNAFHPKAYLFTNISGQVTAYVGSSNLSEPALTHSVEWNYRLTQKLDPSGLAQMREEFASLYTNPHTTELTWEWLNEYRKRRKPLPTREGAPVEVLDDPIPEPPEPHDIQKEALTALAATRSAGNQAGLVVLATGLGKTWLAAFDSETFEKVLFVAHRDEILIQSMNTFRRIRQNSTFGFYNGQEKSPEVDVLFASIQTLGKDQHLQNFSAESFDYIVVDEFHHAHAPTYRRLIDHFTPKFLLGLTATPERTDGGNLLALCGQNLVYRCDLAAGIEQQLLCPIKYYGVPDVVDYRTIPWRSRRFDPEELTQALATQLRAQNVLEQYQRLRGSCTVGFCATTVHADFMARYFRDRGYQAVAVHSGPDSAPRTQCLEQLAQGELDIIFCVDMFNEGLDLPAVDTVMMLRPTESRIIWLQQLGRGLRRCEGKDHLTVIDYIGNHRSFLKKLETLWLEFVGGRGGGDAQLAVALDALQKGEVTLPAGCEVTYELEAVEIIRGLLSRPKKTELLRLYYEDSVASQGTRPTALETYQAGYNPRAAKASYGSWFGFVHAMGGLTEEETECWRLNKEFLDQLETTQMVKSYKMVLLQAMLAEGAFPGSITVDRLTTAFAKVAGRSARLRADVEPHIGEWKSLRQCLLGNPIEAWTKGKGTGGIAYFQLADDQLHTTRLQGDPEILAGLTREIAEWRLAGYLDRVRETEGDGFVVKVNHTGGRPILY